MTDSQRYARLAAHASLLDQTLRGIEKEGLRVDHRGALASRANAVVELTVGGQKIRNTGSGNGPVNALDAALRADLGRYSAHLADLRLADYKVRILTRGNDVGGTEAVTRVMVESVDAKGERWSTVGVSANIVDASFEALTDAIIYKLYRDGADI